MENKNTSSRKPKEVHPTTTEDFQTKLCVWFEEKGVLAELRAHLRHQMIESLKTSEIGRKMSFEKRKYFNLSPKHQAINLLIAEYLSCQGYQYSMSVFSSEVGTLHSLPHCTQENEHLKFHSRDTLDILQSLGFPLDCEESQYISSIYNDRDGDTNQCLLLCLLRTLPTILWNKLKARKDQDEMPTKHCDNMTVRNEEMIRKDQEDRQTQCDNLDREMEENLQGILFEVHKNMQQAFDHELEIAKEEEKQRYLKLSREKEKEMRLENERERANIQMNENRMRESLMREMESEKNRLYEEYRMKEVQLEREVARELEAERYKILNEYKEIIESKRLNANSSPSNTSTNIVELQSSYLNMALEKIQQQSNKLKEKEELLDRRLKEMEEKMKKKQTATECNNKQLKEERERIRKLKEQLDQSLKQIECSKTSKDSNTKEIQTDHAIMQNNKNTQTDSKAVSNKEEKVNTALDTVLKTLHKENIQLKELTAKQSRKIERFVVKQLNMSSEVTEARTQVQELSKQLNYLERCHTLPLKKQDLGVNSNKCKNLTRSSGFKVNYKKISKTFHNESSSDETRQGRKRYNNKKALRKSKENPNNVKKSQTNSEESPTDEILNDAKRRLKLLELETEAMDRSYQEFKMRQETENSVNKEKKTASIQSTQQSKSNVEEYHKTDECKRDSDINNVCAYRHISSPYNTFRRVHQTSMNIDKNMLQSYLTANTIQSNHSATSHHNNYLTFQKSTTAIKNLMSAPQHSPNSRHSGTTAFLLKRIENCTSNVDKYNASNKEFITNDILKCKRKLTNQFTNTITNNKNISQTTAHKEEDYSQYIGISSQQYKIKPTVHWRNIHKVNTETKELDLIKESSEDGLDQQTSGFKSLEENQDSLTNKWKNHVKTTPSQEDGNNVELTSGGENSVKEETNVGCNEIKSNVASPNQANILASNECLINATLHDTVMFGKDDESTCRLQDQNQNLKNDENVIGVQIDQAHAVGNESEEIQPVIQGDNISTKNDSPNFSLENITNTSKDSTKSHIDISTLKDEALLKEQEVMRAQSVENKARETIDLEDLKKDTDNLSAVISNEVLNNNRNSNNGQDRIEDAFHETIILENLPSVLVNNEQTNDTVEILSTLSSVEVSTNSSVISVPRYEDDDNFWM